MKREIQEGGPEEITPENLAVLLIQQHVEEFNN